MAQIVNVLLHGIFGYLFADDYIYAYTPCVCGHVYQTSSGEGYAAATDFPRGDYALEGVQSGSKFPLPTNQYPQVPILLDAKHQIDEFGKRYSMFRLPYPISADKVRALDKFQVGSIYAGRDAGPMNGAGLDNVGQIASLHAFIYASDGTPLQLTPLGSTYGEPNQLKPIPVTKSGKRVGRDTITNFHIWCTTPPMDKIMGDYTSEGHLRRGFVALVDMFPRIEITIQIPDGFTPEAIDDQLPPGVTKCDVDPGREGCPKFGHVNCHYANVLFVPPVSAKPRNAKSMGKGKMKR